MGQKGYGSIGCTGTGSMDTSNWVIQNNEYDNSNSTGRIFVDNELVHSGTGSLDPPSNTSELPSFGIYKRDYSREGFEGKLYECLVFDSALAPKQRDKVFEFTRSLKPGSTETWDSAVQLRDAMGGKAPSGTYKIRWDGTNARDVHCEMDLEGGGWMMILNYVHKGGTNPSLDVRTDSFPQMAREYILGADESGSAAWGHIGNALAAQNGFTEYMFYGKTSNHDRVIHFRGSVSNVIDYIKTGTGDMSGIGDSGNYTQGSLAANGPYLPGAMDLIYNDRGDLAMTNFPFYNISDYHWGILGLGDRWEVDDYPNNASKDTIHRIWVR